MTLRNGVTSRPESSCFRTPFESQRVQGCQTLLKPARQHFYPTFPLIRDKLPYKTSLLGKSEILVMFRNTLIADHMYSSHNWKKVLHQVQTLLSKKGKKFSRIFIGILESIQNFAHFEKKDQLHSFNISKVIDQKKCGYFNAQKPLF